MTNKLKELTAWGIWLCLYILCVALGTLEDVKGVARVFFMLTSLIFFLPGVYLLYLGYREKNRKIRKRVRIAAILSLTLTVVVFSCNVIAVSASAEAGRMWYDLLNLVSAPMLCSQYWILSIFCWAGLLSASFMKIEKK